MVLGFRVSCGRCFSFATFAFCGWFDDSKGCVTWTTVPSTASNIKVFVLAWCSHPKRSMDCKQSARVKDISLFHTATIRDTSQHNTFLEYLPLFLIWTCWCYPYCYISGCVNVSDLPYHTILLVHHLEHLYCISIDYRFISVVLDRRKDQRLIWRGYDARLFTDQLESTCMPEISKHHAMNQVFQPS